MASQEYWDGEYEKIWEAIPIEEVEGAAGLGGRSRQLPDPISSGM